MRQHLEFAAAIRRKARNDALNVRLDILCTAVHTVRGARISTANKQAALATPSRARPTKQCLKRTKRAADGRDADSSQARSQHAKSAGRNRGCTSGGRGGRGGLGGDAEGGGKLLAARDGDGARVAAGLVGGHAVAPAAAAGVRRSWEGRWREEVASGLERERGRVDAGRLAYHLPWWTSWGEWW